MVDKPGLPNINQVFCYHHMHALLAVDQAHHLHHDASAALWIGGAPFDLGLRSICCGAFDDVLCVEICAVVGLGADPLHRDCHCRNARLDGFRRFAQPVIAGRDFDHRGVGTLCVSPRAIGGTDEKTTLRLFFRELCKSGLRCEVVLG